jgi:hypothetical protein
MHPRHQEQLRVIVGPVVNLIIPPRIPIDTPQHELAHLIGRRAERPQKPHAQTKLKLTQQRPRLRLPLITLTHDQISSRRPATNVNAPSDICPGDRRLALLNHAQPSTLKTGRAADGSGKRDSDSGLALGR